MEKMAQICQISKTKVSESPDFYDKFQWVAKNIEGFCFFFFVWAHFNLHVYNYKLISKCCGPSKESHYEALLSSARPKGYASRWDCPQFQVHW